MWLGRVALAGFWASFLSFYGLSGQVTRNILFSPGAVTTSEARQGGSVIIYYRLPEMDLSSVSNDAGSFYRLSAPDHITTSEPGKPELPVYCKLLVLPENLDYKIRISDVRSQRIRPQSKDLTGLLYPAQESRPKTVQDGKTEFRIDRSMYNYKGFIPGDTVRIEPLGKARNSNLGNVIISPVSYNPKSNSLEVITSMNIEIVFNESLDISASASDRSLFTNSITKGALNYGMEVITDYTENPLGMIILTDTAFRKQLEPFIKWKTKKGFRVTTLYKGASYAGNTIAEIKATLTNIYNSATEEEPAPDYLLIVGDVTRIPCYGNGTSLNYTDMYYGEFTGAGDYVPDMYVGRVPATDTVQVRSFVKKVIDYETFSFADTNKFFKNALATTGYDNNNAVYMNGQIRYLVNNYLVSDRIREYHFLHYSGTEPDNYLPELKDSIITIINQGTSFINYSGHGDEKGWLNVNIKTDDTSLLKNKDKYPVIISNACRTATFNADNSFSNSLVLGPNSGAAGFIGCSNDSYWNEDYFWTVGVGSVIDNPSYSGKSLGSFDRLFHTHAEYPSDWYYTLGQINYAGNLSVSTSTSSRKKYYWETYNIVGDPSMIPIIGEPLNFDFTLPDTLPNGLRSLTLALEPFAYAAISHSDTLWDASFAGITGGVSLEMPGISDDSCTIVITGQNRYPVIKTIYFGNVNEEFLNLNSIEVNDKLGNNNKKADYKEQFYLSLYISNMGLTDASNVFIKITSASGWLDIISDSVAIGTVNSRTNQVINDKLLIGIADEVPDKGIATLDLMIKSDKSEKHYPLQLVMHAPSLLIENYIIDDTSGGNGDFTADPGETFNLIIRVRNDGSSDATGDLFIGNISPGIELLYQDVANALIKAGQITDIRLSMQLSGSVLSGSYLNFTSNLDADPYMLIKNFTFRAGKLRESFEAMSFNIFPWINKSYIPWIVTPANSYDGIISARSGTVSHNGSSSLVMKSWYPGADTIRFSYKVTSELNCDHLIFMINGREVLKKSGEIPWTKVAFPVSPGLNQFEWIYKKDNSVSSPPDCAWIDMIDFATSTPVKYIRRDLMVKSIVTPLEKNYIGLGTIKVRLMNVGKDTINGFNLAFRTDKSQIVAQHFSEVLRDSIEVSFKSKADLSHLGKFNIYVYGFNNGDDYLENDTARIEIENDEIYHSMTIYPNPVIDDIKLFLSSINDDNVTLTITDPSGSEIYKTKRAVSRGGNTLSITGLKIVPAVYYLNVRGSTINKTIPFIKSDN